MFTDIYHFVWYFAPDRVFGLMCTQKERTQAIEHSVFSAGNILFRIKYRVWTRLDLVVIDGKWL